MSLNRRSFVRALFGTAFAAPAIERIIANGVAKPPPEPVKFILPAVVDKWEAPPRSVYSDRWTMTGTSLVTGFWHGPDRYNRTTHRYE